MEINSFNKHLSSEHKIWDALCQMGCKPVPLGNFGYSFEYENFNGVYFPAKTSSGLVRFAFPKLASVKDKSEKRLLEIMNVANSLVAESKFTLTGNDVWLVYERVLSETENYPVLVSHILENLKTGAEVFYKIS